MISFSVVVPVYNRPQEMDELCETLCHQTYKNFNLVVVEDGSTIPSEEVLKKYQSKLNIDYYFKRYEEGLVNEKYDRVISFYFDKEDKLTKITTNVEEILDLKLPIVKSTASAVIPPKKLK